MSNEINDRINDWLKQANKSSMLVTSYFLSEDELALIMPKLKYLDYTISGGYPNAKRVIVGFNGNPADKINCLVAHYRSKFVKVSHPDVFGALMGLGLAKSKVGDIFVFNDKICIYVMSDVARDIVSNLNQINKLNVKFTISDELYYMEQDYDVYQKSVASLRLDVLVAALANTSREKAKELLANKQIKLNHRLIEDSSCMCHNNDTISIHRVGRFIFSEVLKTTKKDRLLIEYKKYK